MLATNRHARALALGLLATTLVVADASALTWTCTTVAKKRAPDPLLGTFTTKFNDPDINAAGDVTFHAKVKNGGRRLYLYPNGGAAVIIATDGDPAPSTATQFRKFSTSTINAAGDVGFFADLAVGEGVFIREAGGTIVKAAITGDPSPGGGTFDRIVVVSHINLAGDISFIAKVTGGPDGVFFFDRSAGTVSAVALVGDPTGTGREFCEFLRDCAVGLSDLGNSVFQATTAVDCVAGPEVGGIWQEALLGFTEVAEVGDASSIPGTTYAKLLGAPHANAADKVLFRAKVNPADTCNNVTANLCTLDTDCANTCTGGTNVGEACTTLLDCPDQSGGTACTAGICGGDRCVGGADIGKPCSTDSDCPGGACDVPGQRNRALFLFDPVGPTTTTVVAEGDAAVPNGTLKTIAPPGGLTNGDQAGFRAKVRHGTASQGAFLFNGSDDAVVLRNHAVPTDAFGLGSTYRKIVEETGVDRTGTWFTFSARVRDTSVPPGNAGLFRCEGM